MGLSKNERAPGVRHCVDQPGPTVVPWDKRAPSKVLYGYQICRLPAVECGRIRCPAFGLQT
jgi:hypothetical protein